MSGFATDLFSTTRWSVVMAAGGTDDKAKGQALASLCTAYWRPVFAYIRCRGNDAEMSKDLTQGFFATLLENDWLAGLRQEGSRFRAFLLVAVKRYLATDYDRRTAQKRGGGVAPVPLDMTRGIDPPSPEETPEKAFDRRWALEVLDRAIGRLQAEARDSGREALFVQVARHISSDPEPGDYERLAASFGISRAAVAMATHRLRLRLREHVRAEVAETLSSPGQVEGEMRELVAALRG